MNLLKAISFWTKICAACKQLFATLFICSSLLCLASVPILAQDVNTIVIIDRVGDDHTLERQTKVTRRTGTKTGEVSYLVERQVRPKGDLHFSKRGPAYLDPISVGEFTLYPEMYCRQGGVDRALKSETLLFDETTQLVLEGQVLDDLIDEKRPITKELQLPRRERSITSCGFTARRVVEIDLAHDSPLNGTYSSLIKNLGGDSTGFVGNPIDEIRPGSPADAAGLRAQDVVLEINSRLTDRQRATEIVCDYLTSGTKVPIVIARRLPNGQIEILQLTITPIKASQESVSKR